MGRKPRHMTSEALEGTLLLFYSHAPNKAYREFSNFFVHNRPYRFNLPGFACRQDLPTFLWCEFSEKAIMATKAALMGDAEMFKEIEVAPDPASCKALGRGVRNFDEELWQRHLEAVAFEVVKQKFQSEKALRELLLTTGNRAIAEAAPNDSIWGIGMSSSDPNAQDPAKWRGRNILGNALMQARSYIRGDAVDASVGAASSSTETEVLDVDHTIAIPGSGPDDKAEEEAVETATS
mmetsp:Transcript_9942/g.14003  ORF Transcript_9942/g.14003 Transcript_9942/m.14003 type:complete len:236 (-) Transcript_9942:44-751(-)